jgi:hypothetical protein
MLVAAAIRTFSPIPETAEEHEKNTKITNNIKDTQKEIIRNHN